MIDHITFGVSDFQRSAAFYDRLLATLGVKRLFDGQDGPVKVAGYGDTRPWFWIAEHDPTSGKLHIAFGAESRGLVDAFHAAGLAADGADNGPPGVRPHYHANYYGAFVLDPDGHNIEAVCHSPAA